MTTTTTCGKIVTKQGKNMYKTVLLTQKEIEILATIVAESISTKTGYEDRNLTIILNRLREKIPQKLANETNIWADNPQIN